MKIELALRNILAFLCLLLWSCDPEDEKELAACRSEINTAPQQMPANLRNMMEGLLNHHYWMLTNPQGDTLIITAQPDYSVKREDHPDCECEECAQTVSFVKHNIVLDFTKIPHSSFRQKEEPFNMTIYMKDRDSPIDVLTMNRDNMLWSFKTDSITDAQDVTERWKILPGLSLNDKIYERVFFRESVDKINFDRGYEWLLSPDVGYLALYDKAGLFYPKDHDTLTLKTYH